MWMDLYQFAHNSLGLHFWDLTAFLVGAAILAVWIVHVCSQKKREERFDKERTKRLETMQKEAAKTAGTSG